MDADKSYQFTNGHFEWNNVYNKIYFASHDVVTPECNTTLNKITNVSESDVGLYNIEFKDDIDITDKITFKRRYSRKIKLNDPTVILLQDVKDATLFIANPKHLSKDLILFLHKPAVDKFLRNLIIYFQFYLQTWEKLRTQREELKTKIRHPGVEVFENNVAYDLSNLRCMLAREHIMLLVGGDEQGKYLKSRGRVLLAEKDRRLFEHFTQIATRIVWFALHKPSISAIEREIDRLLHSNHYNKYVHQRIQQKKPMISFSDNEKNILRGKGNLEQRRLITKSPLANEILYRVHDHRMLAIGQVDFPPSTKRLRFLEKLFLIPEEDFAENKICIGILGMPRDNFDVMLKQKRKKQNEDDDSIEELILNFEIPARIKYFSYDKLPWDYPKTPPRYTIKTRKKLLRQQCNIWLKRVENAYQLDTTIKDYTTISMQSI